MTSHREQIRRPAHSRSIFKAKMSFGPKTLSFFLSSLNNSSPLYRSQGTQPWEDSTICIRPILRVFQHSYCLDSYAVFLLALFSPTDRFSDPAFFHGMYFFLLSFPRTQTFMVLYSFVHLITLIKRICASKSVPFNIQSSSIRFFLDLFFRVFLHLTVKKYDIFKNQPNLNRTPSAISIAQF